MLRTGIRASGETAKTIVGGLALAAFCTCAQAAESMAELIKRDIAVAAAQYSLLLEKTAGKPGFPRTLDQGELKLVGPRDWTSGFVPGTLWYLFEATGEPKWRAAAAPSRAPPPPPSSTNRSTTSASSSAAATATAIA